jgi:hypothetical protein
MPHKTQITRQTIFWAGKTRQRSGTARLQSKKGKKCFSFILVKKVKTGRKPQQTHIRKSGREIGKSPETHPIMVKATGNKSQWFICCVNSSDIRESCSSSLFSPVLLFLFLFVPDS